MVARAAPGSQICQLDTTPSSGHELQRCMLLTWTVQGVLQPHTQQDCPFTDTHARSVERLTVTAGFSLRRDSGWEQEYYSTDLLVLAALANWFNVCSSPAPTKTSAMPETGSCRFFQIPETTSQMGSTKVHQIEWELQRLRRSFCRTSLIHPLTPSVSSADS